MAQSLSFIQSPSTSNVGSLSVVEMSRNEKAIPRGMTFYINLTLLDYLPSKFFAAFINPPGFLSISPKPPSAN